ncbi:protein tyrosine phosphatase type IVA 2 isoform X2 [Dermacentor albipictus]|uniref:protein tyrosine phosphatase type IVA 2 isoform X2 n=1 Tax=Dermacentor albipictus TaxID=60249 RepID=UPI0031FC3EED
MCCVPYGVSGLADCAVLRRCAMSAPAMRHKAAAMRPGPSEIDFKNMRFLITDRPTDATVPAFLEEFKKRNVKDVVRVCEATYQKDLLEKEGINVWDWQFDDGSPPPARIVEEWFQLLRKRFKEDPDCCIAVHCVAGLGRKRRGAINAKQLSYLEKYRPKSRLRLRNGHRQCTIQ